MCDEFLPVTRKKWIARRNIHWRQPRTCDITNIEIMVDKFLDRILHTCRRMSASAYFIRAMATIKQSLADLPEGVKLMQMVCFGIGPFTNTFQSLHQLAFALELQKYFNIDKSFYFDPVFQRTEKEILTRLHCTLIEDDCEAKYQAAVTTLFYMPHCPNYLTNNLLWRNWEPTLLQNIVLINNSFDSLSSSRAKRLLWADSQYILYIVEHTKEYKIEDDYNTRNIFNDLSVHVFPANEMPSASDKFWAQKEATIYEDVKIIPQDDLAKLTIS